MLQFKTVDPKVLELLKKLMTVDEFSNLRLVGGTSLSLQIGHRKSIDIDLFGNYPDDIDFIKLISDIGNYTWLKKSRNINIFYINNIKVDFVNYPYKWLENELKVDNIRLANIMDIAAMKINAITGRGAKKDFIDLFFILKYFTFNEILNFYSQKYGGDDVILALKSIAYFEDANEEEMPVMFNNVGWDEIKKYIAQELNNYIKQG